MEEIEVLHKGKFLKLVKKGTWEYVERIPSHGIVIIIPVTKEKKLVLIEQFRIPVDKVCLELPAGIAGDVMWTDLSLCKKCDDLANKFCDFHLGCEANRELVEETGYKAGKMTLVSKGPSSCGLTSELVTMFLAEDLEKVGEGGGVDEDENITTYEVPINDVPQFIANAEKEGKLVDPKLFAALYFVGRHGY